MLGEMAWAHSPAGACERVKDAYARASRDGRILITGPARNRGEAFEQQGRLEDAIGLLGRHFGWRDDADFTADAFIQDKIFAGNLAHEFSQSRNIDVVKIHRDQIFFAAAPGLPGENRRLQPDEQNQNQYRKEPPHQAKTAAPASTPIRGLVFTHRCAVSCPVLRWRRHPIEFRLHPANDNRDGSSFATIGRLTAPRVLGRDRSLAAWTLNFRQPRPIWRLRSPLLPKPPERPSPKRASGRTHLEFRGIELLADCSFC